MKETRDNRPSKLHNSTLSLRHVTKDSHDVSSRNCKGSASAAAAAVALSSVAVGPMSAYLDGLLTYSMQDCYSKLKDLVPSLQPNEKVSKVELLQHVIDYIQDLQGALETHPALRNSPPPPLMEKQSSNRTPLGTIPPENTVITEQVSHLEKTTSSTNWELDSCSPRSC
ncbi:DNA-binding protein inhibitor ID-2-like [Glandiceps talaboti]